MAMTTHWLLHTNDHTYACETPHVRKGSRYVTKATHRINCSPCLAVFQGASNVNVCRRCGTQYTGDPERLQLGNRLCNGCQCRHRSTCFTYTTHPSHNWEHVTTPLWCPGTDGSNPQVPPVQAKELRGVFGV